MPRTFVSAVAFSLACAGAARAQAPAAQPPTSAPRSLSTVTLTGCVSRSPDGKGFLLTQQAGAPGTVTSPQTSSAAGTSATGDAPSGSVTANTPEGTTATETAVPTPPVAEP